MCQLIHYAVGSRQAKGGTARQHHGVDALDRIMRLQKVCFAGARAAAAHVDAAERATRPAVEHCDSGIGAAIVPDAHAV